jgi:hypothetical protein
MTDKMDLEQPGNGKSSLRAAADDRLSSSPDVSPKLKDKTPEEIIH